MEYFAKFTRHIGKPRKPPSPGASQLAKFEKAWKSAQSICYYQSKWRRMPVDQTPLPDHLVVMFDLLVQEDIRQSDADDSTTGACMEYLLGSNVLEDLVRLAEADEPIGVRRVIISNLTTLVSLTDDKLLVQKAVHNPILDILRSYSYHDPGADASVTLSAANIISAQQRLYDDDFVDLLYAICSKIRGEPMLLNIFFHDSKWLKSVEQRNLSSDSIAAMMRSVESLRSEGAANPTSYEFLLFSHLLHFVHREGKAGDTARTSLLFLLELATTEIMASTSGNTALERFILDDSGFAAILSATLCALYSQLPRSLQVSTGPAAVIPGSLPSYSADLQNAIESSIFSSGAANGGSGNSTDRWTDGQGPVKSTNPEFRACLSSFASMLCFIQDVLFRCPSSHVCDQLLRSLRDNFLQSILYPSLLESSDTDGSSVAVMRYLETMLQVVRHESLVSVFMDFLTDEATLGDADTLPPTLAGADSSPSPITSGDKQGALAAEHTSTSTSTQSSPAPGCLPFTLRDLIYTNLQSSVSIDAVVSALNLLRIVLSKHCRYSSRLIEMERKQPASIKNGWMTNCTVAIDVHRQELDMYAKLMVQLQTDPYDAGHGGAEPDNVALVIPWRHDTPATPTLASSPAPVPTPTPSSIHSSRRPRLDHRAAIKEAFSVGYDEYLEDAALDWDAHESYHAEIDALFAAQATQKTSAGGKGLSAPSKISKLAVPERSGAAPPFSAGKQMRMRPRKYSEAVMMPAAQGAQTDAEDDRAARGTSVSQLTGRRQASPPAPSSSNRQCRHSRHNIKPSDPVIRALMSLLARYFAQPRECNLALTGVLAALVGCPYRSLDPWLGFNMGGLLGGVLSKPWNAWMENLRSIGGEGEGEFQDSSDSEGEDDPCGSKKMLGRAPMAAIAAADAPKYVGLDEELQAAIRALPRGTTPPSLYLVVSGLAQQSRVLRNEIPDFTRRLKRARNALMGIVEDVEDLDEEFESASNRSEANASLSREPRTRDRGLSSASLESTRGSSVAASFGSRRDRSTSVSASVNKQQQRQAGIGAEDAASLRVAEGGAQARSTLSGSTRNRSGSAGYMSELASVSSASASARRKSGSANGMASSAVSAAASSVESALSGTAALHALSVPPANANIAEFLENVIILQESIKEIIARAQVRRENGGDENAII